MTDDSSGLTRRTALKGLAGGATVAGLGGLGLLATGSAAAMSSTFSAANVPLSFDTGDVDDIYVEPSSTVEWSNFDVPVTKIRQTLFARLKQNDSVVTDTPTPNPVPGQDGYWPVYRGTPWLFTTTEVTDGDFEYNGDPAKLGYQWPYMQSITVSGGDGQKSPGTSGSVEYLLGADPDTGDQSPIYVAQEGTPRPTDYAESTLTGVSIGNAPTRVNGAYGTVGDTGEFDNATDDSEQVTTVELGLLTTAHTDYDFAENVTVPNVTNPDRLSPLAMGNSDDVGYAFGGDTHAIAYSELVDHAGSHPAVEWITTAYDVTVTNQASDQGSTTTANTGGS